MRYQGEQAIGLIETITVPALLAADAMLKAGDTELISYENVGSTLVTVIVRGDGGLRGGCQGRRRGSQVHRQADGPERYEATRARLWATWSLVHDVDFRRKL